MNALYNLARVTTATTGTGTITLGAAVSGFLTFAQAGVPDGAVVTYAIEDANGGHEVGQGTYTLSGTTLTRTTVYRSTGAGNTGKITLSGSAQVFITVAAEDLAAIPLANVTGLAANVAAFLADPTSAKLLAAVSDETGAGLLVFGNTPTLITPIISGLMDVAGSMILSSNAGNWIYFDNAAALHIAADGVGDRLLVTTSGLLAFAGETSAFPALKRSATALQVRLADDSDYAPFRAAASIVASLQIGAASLNTSATLSGSNSSTTISSTYDPSITVMNTNTTDNNYEGIIFRQTNTAAGGSDAGAIFAQNVSHTAGAVKGDLILMSSNGGAAEVVRLTWDKLLAFQGKTSSFPALKRSSTTLQVRLADDSADAPISAAAAAFSGVVTGTALTGNKLSDQIYDLHVRATAQLDKTSNTTLADVTGMSVVLQAGKAYILDGWLSTTAGASGGLKVQLVASGGLSITSGRYGAIALNGTTTVANTTVTALGTNIVANNAVITDVDISGVLVVNAGGTLTVQAAQNTSNGTTTSVFANSYLMAKRIS